MALERGLTAIALTDHDTVGGVAEAQAAAAGTGLMLIPGVEVNAAGGDAALHILGFYIDPQTHPLTQKLQQMRDARTTRARQMLRRLRRMGMTLAWEEVQALAEGHSIGRPHIARALHRRGYVNSIQEAFERWIGPGRPAYVSRLRLTPEETIHVIHQAGGVPVLAHPAHSGQAVLDHIPALVAQGLRGLEVYYPEHSPAEIEMLLALCREHGLIATGGSDFHGPDSAHGAPLGSVQVPAACLEALQRAAGR